MTKALKPWLLLGVLLAILALFTGGMSVGKKLERTSWLEREQELQALADKETRRANEIAQVYGLSLAASQDVAHQLRRKLNEQRTQLATHQPDGSVYLTGAFVSLYNDAMQAGPHDLREPAGSTSGTGVAELGEVAIENGKRWKDCRNQLNALIDILEPLQ